jgi:hypothetical protein
MALEGALKQALFWSWKNVVLLNPYIAFRSKESIDECTDICVEKRVDVREVQASK